MPGMVLCARGVFSPAVPPPSSRSTFSPRYTLLLLYFFVLVMLFCLLFALPALVEAYRSLPPGTARSRPPSSKPRRETARTALSGRIVRRGRRRRRDAGRRPLEQRRPRPAKSLRSAQPRDHELDHRVEERLRRVRRAGRAARRDRLVLEQAVRRRSRGCSRPPTRRPGGTRRARRRRGSRRRGCAGTRPRASSPRRRRLPALADHLLVLERPEDPEVLGVRGPVLVVEAAEAADLVGGPAAALGASRMRCSKSAPLCESTAT